MKIRSIIKVYVKVFWVVLYSVCHVKYFKSVLIFFNIYGVCLLCDALVLLNR